MLKCHIDSKKRKHQWVKANGTAQELRLETTALVKLIYENLNSQNPEAAKEYKHQLIGVLLDPESPVWKEG